MAPGALHSPKNAVRRFVPVLTKITGLTNSLLNRSINFTPLRVASGRGNYYVLDDGREIYDTSGGAAVSSIGKRNDRVENAMIDVIRRGLCYVPSLAFDTKVTADFAEFMLNSTGGEMEKAIFYCSGQSNWGFDFLL
jgi:4-aminobutyrate aminotransferase-like enzyme